MDLSRFKPKPRKQDNRIKYFGWMVVLGSVVALVLRLPLIDGAAALAILAFAEMAFTWIKMPRVARKILTAPGIRWCVDLMVSFGIPVAMGFTVTGIFAGFIVGIYVSLALEREAETLWGGAHG